MAAMGAGTPNDGLADAWLPDLVTAQEYYVFGGLIADRSYAQGGEAYRYGFNGKENMDNVAGAGNFQDYGMRSYDPRIGRFTSVDPLAKSYPFYTPYQYAGNNPIANSDLDGAEPDDFRSNWQYPAFGRLNSKRDDRDNDGSITVTDPKLGRINVKMVHDLTQKKSWFVHRDDQGNFYYYKPTAANGNPAEMPLKINRTTGDNLVQGGSFRYFQSQDHKQAILGKNLANGMATGVFAVAAIGAGGIALLEGGGSLVVSQALRYGHNVKQAQNVERTISSAANLVGQYVQNIPEYGLSSENLSKINITQVVLAGANPSSAISNAVIGNAFKITQGGELSETIVGKNFNAKDALVGSMIDATTGAYGRGLGNV